MFNMKSIPTLLKSCFIYAFFGVISASIPFFLLPILTRYLIPSEYILVDLFTNFFQILAALIGLNIYNSVDRFYVDKDKIDFSKYLSTVLTFILVTSILFLLLIPLFKYVFNVFIDIDVTYFYVSSLIFYTIFFQLTEIQFSIFIMQNKPVSFGLYRALKTILDLGLSLLFIVVIDMSWEGRILGQVIAIVFLAILMLYKLRKEFSLRLTIYRKYLYDSISYSFPLSFHIISAIILGYIDRIFIIKMISIEEAGIYSVAYQIGLVISLLSSSFIKAWSPYFFNKMKDKIKGYKRQIVMYSYIYIFCILSSVFILWLFTNLIFTSFIGIEYSTGQKYVVWISLGYAFNGIYRMMVGYLFFFKKTKILASISIALGILNILLNYFFVKRYGAIGAAQATCLAFFCQLVVVWFIVNKRYPMPWFSKFNNDNESVKI